MSSPFSRAINEIDRMKGEPRLLVILTHGMVELIVNTLIDAKCKNAKKITKNNRDFPHSTKLTILNEMRWMTDHHYRLLNWFRKLRNDAAHEPFFELTAERLDILTDAKFRDPDHFFALCVFILLDLWAIYSDIVGPVLNPPLYEVIDGKTKIKINLFSDTEQPHLISLKAESNK